ncbi:hypothetical protein [Clostridium sp.]|uniref:hypothetical protein n=1 Tax=Clostridium sp. TaxID=1506 RepID=UPI00291401C2|nr:hypothetical protein [Clostridium sp.]MDU5105860.1 hypothetical protein [Clostridium sp.]
MKKEEIKDNIDTYKKGYESNKVKNLISSYRTDILQRIFGAKGGKNLLYTIIIVCFGRGLIGKFVFHETFIYAFFYPLIIVGIVSVIYVTLKVINFKNIKLAKILEKIIFIVGSTFLILIILLLIVLVLNKLLHFWF